MRPRGSLIQVGGVDLLNVIAHHQIIQSLLLVGDSMYFYIFHLEVGLLVFQKDNL